MKMPIAHHRECLRNSEIYEEEQRAALERLKKALERLQRGNAFKRAQIERAEKEGRDGFDAEKFMAIKLTINGREA